jgi:hypothetical protein
MADVSQLEVLLTVEHLLDYFGDGFPAFEQRVVEVDS